MKLKIFMDDVEGPQLAMMVPVTEVVSAITRMFGSKTSSVGGVGAMVGDLITRFAGGMFSGQGQPGQEEERQGPRKGPKVEIVDDDEYEQPRPRKRRRRR
jgi:hypothetical protein